MSDKVNVKYELNILLYSNYRYTVKRYTRRLFISETEKDISSKINLKHFINFLPNHLTFMTTM